MISFDLLAFLAWVFISSFIPGALLSFGLLRREEFTRTEKTLIGFGLGFILMPLIPFLLYILLGVKFSHAVALGSVALLYAIGAALFVYRKAYEDLIPREIKLTPGIAVPAALALILLLTFIVRVGTYGPVFQELDPYFYTYPAGQLLTLGENPHDDQTAWYPEEEVNHRVVPLLSYLEASWYALYTGGAPFDNMLLALIASLYPPIAAVLSVFSIYLFVSVITKREYGIVAAGLASFVPVFIMKLAAGEQEVQPYAFFSLALFYAFYALSMKHREVLKFENRSLRIGKDFLFPALAGLAYAAIALGSQSQILAASAMLLFVPLASLLYFLRDEDTEELKHIIAFNSIIFLIGPVLASGILKAFFETGSVSLNVPLAVLAAILFSAALYAVKLKLPDKTSSRMALGCIILLGIIAYAATPAGTYIKDIGKAGFGIAQFNRPLDRTIAEQAPAGTSFSGSLGFIAQSYEAPSSLDSITELADAVMFVVLLPFSLAANVALALFIQLINLALGTSVDFTAKTVSFLLLWIFLFWAACAYALVKFAKREEDAAFLLLLAVVMPPFIVGIVKAKYTIYSGVLLAVAIAFVLHKVSESFSRFFRDLGGAALAHAPLLIGAALLLMQFSYQGFAPALAWGSLQPLYQNDPAGLAPKFTQFCESSGDADVCAAASDPLGYAGRGTNYQYSTKLCMLSIFSDYRYFSYLYDGDGLNDGQVPQLEASVASFRCQRVSDYWIDSMEWIRDNTPEGARITSWWDYGHWINYFGERNAALRNEHRSHEMIGAVAHGYTDATPEELRDWMKAHDSEYALFDIELVSSGGALGGKYGALNYLSCAWHNETTVQDDPGTSECESEHLWEMIFVTGTPCTISELTGKTGLTAYRIYEAGRYLNYYPPECAYPSQDPNIVNYCTNYVRAVPAYCVGNATLASGEQTYATYYLDETYPNGDLKLNKGLMQLFFQMPTTHLGTTTASTLFYTEDAIWLENGEVKPGYGDRKGKFYDSAIYRAIFLEDLPGFELVYRTPTGAVKIYKIKE
ncbi:MAG: hypothetical protein AB1324_03815 [Candidatus Micrarchaeota archaeon]